MLERVLGAILAILMLGGGMWLLVAKDDSAATETPVSGETPSFVFVPGETGGPRPTVPDENDHLGRPSSEPTNPDNQALPDQEKTGDWLADFAARLKKVALLSPETQARTDFLRRFGNEVAVHVQGGPDNFVVAATLSALLNNENDANAAQNLAILAEDYSTLGDKLAHMTNVPPEAKNEHQSFAAAYRELGMRLAAAAVSPPPRIDAFERYTESVNNYIGAAIGMIDLFDAYNVVFEGGEPGSIFSINL